MVNSKTLLTTLLLSLILPSLIWADVLVPITKGCIHYAANYHQVPVAALYGIFATEGGVVGESSINKNRTYDNGPMQINSIKVKDLQKMGVTEKDLRNNGCYNVFVAAWILRQHLERTADIWEAIGDYHSKSYPQGEIYKRKVLLNLLRAGKIDEYLARANKNIERLP